MAFVYGIYRNNELRYSAKRAKYAREWRARKKAAV